MDGPSVLQRWEYRVEVVDADGFKNLAFKHLDMNWVNTLGAEGWELFSTDAVTGEPTWGLPHTTRLALWFRRPLTGEPE